MKGFCDNHPRSRFLPDRGPNGVSGYIDASAAPHWAALISGFCEGKTMTQCRQSSGDARNRTFHQQAIGLAAVSALALSCSTAMAQFQSVVKTGVAVPGQGTSFTNVNIAG